MSNASALLRERLIDGAREPMTRPALLLSGGVDSGMILAALLAAGHRPALYVIQFGEHASLSLINPPTISEENIRRDFPGRDVTVRTPASS